MKLEEADRDLFEVFGEPEAPGGAHLHEIDIDALHEEALAERKARKIKTPFSWAAFCGGLAALVWIGGAIGGPLSLYGVDAVMAMDPAMQAGLIALALGPALLFWLASAAAGEAVKARSFAAELARLTQNGFSPAADGQIHAQRLSASVKGEIDVLNDAVSSAFNRLNELETVAHRNAKVFDGAVSATRENAELMTSRLEQERAAIASLNSELRGQTETMAHTIGRQVRLMREASKLVKSEITAAEDALENHLASFAASAAMMGERTTAFHQAADAAHAVTGKLNGAMANMLEGLSEATRLTDAARKSSEQAVVAANETAAAVRETTRVAVFEAKRAAQAIRAETQALQDAAADTLARLKAAAATRVEEKPSSSAASLLNTMRAAERRAERAPQSEAQDEGLYSAAAAAMVRGAQHEPAHEELENQRRSSFGSAFRGIGSWGNFTPARTESPAPANTSKADDAFSLVDFGRPARDPDATLKADAIDIVLAAGVDLGSALAAADLEMIARNSRHGASARREAVTDAAPVAVGRIARHIRRHAEAREIASAFRARPDLTKSEKKGEGSELVRAYLLLDAALA